MSYRLEKLKNNANIADYGLTRWNGCRRPYGDWAFHFGETRKNNTVVLQGRTVSSRNIRTSL